MMYDEIEKQVLEKIKPDSETRKKIRVTLSDLKKRLKEEIKKNNVSAKVEVVGSIAKDTYLRNSLDIDVFLSYPTRFPREIITRNTLSIGKKIIRHPVISYAEHPYVKGEFKGFEVELVPCYQIEEASQKLSAVDRTPLHTEFIKKNIKEQQKDQVRLLKQFLRGIGCYGAENKIEGFSGYLCELLILKNKDFRGLTRSASVWKIGEKLFLKKVETPDFNDPLVFIDPVDSNRNVASALSRENYLFFIKACREYLKKPRLTFFFPNRVKPWSVERIREELKKQGVKFVGVKLVKPDVIDENLYPQIRKTCRSIKEACVRHGFKVYDVRFHVNDEDKEIYIFLKTPQGVLSETYEHVGPPVRMQKNKEDFIRKWGKHTQVVGEPYEKNGRLYVKVKREHRVIEDFLRETLPCLSLGKNIDENVKKGFNILRTEEMLDEKLAVYWTKYLDKKNPWER